ncbi:gluconate 2-dehydrogenase subunit 3 family protein [Sulfurimicrobium lacus]|nr:gluconate 2-dehydrogenase subunit 3 family protein [Sulfurimicrobium lacus]
MPASQARRRLLKIIGVFFIRYAFDAGPALASATTGLERSTFAAFLDMLLPRDEFSGSATDLHVDEKLWEVSRSDPRFRRLIGLGCQWLNMTGGPPFAALSGEQQYALVDWMAHSDFDQVPRRFYELVREAAIEMYYSQPEAWHGLSIQNPPQPLGYKPPWP